MRCNFNEAKNIKEKFGEEKVICEILDHSLKITFFKSRIWLYEFCFFLILLLNYANLHFLLTADEEKKGFFILATLLIISIFTFLKSINTLRFEKNKIISKNLFGIQKTFDISKLPHCYIHYKEYTIPQTNGTSFTFGRRFVMTIEQRSQNTTFDLQLMNRQKLITLIDNFSYLSIKECSKHEWQQSINPKRNEFHFPFSILLIALIGFIALIVFLFYEGLVGCGIGFLVILIIWLVALLVKNEFSFEKIFMCLFGGVIIISGIAVVLTHFYYSNFMKDLKMNAIYTEATIIDSDSPDYYFIFYDIAYTIEKTTYHYQFKTKNFYPHNELIPIYCMKENIKEPYIPSEHTFVKTVSNCTILSPLLIIFGFLLVNHYIKK